MTRPTRLGSDDDPQALLESVGAMPSLPGSGARNRDRCLRRGVDLTANDLPADRIGAQLQFTRLFGGDAPARLRSAG